MCVTRRAAIAGVAALPIFHIRASAAAGKLSVAFASSFVPGWDETIRRLVETWGNRNAVSAQVDFLSTTSNQTITTPAAEAQARVGHDIVHLYRYEVARYADQLEPVDALVAHLIAAHGAPTEGLEYLAKIAGTWRATPTSLGSVNHSTESRIDLFRDLVGLDVPETFPAADTMGPGYDQWSWDAFLGAAEKCFKANVPFGLLDYLKQLARFLPPDVHTWNDASNNRALISGKSALIFNPPSAWASAVRDNPPVGARIWHHPLPAGKHGRWLPWGPAFLGIWDFSPNKSAAKDLIAWLGERDQVEASLIASHGYDIPVFAGLTDFPMWADAGPPKGTLFNYPLRPAQHAKAIVAGAPAPPPIAAGIYAQWVLPKLAGRVTQAGMSIENAMAETERDLAGIIGR
jgi:hypothetical protein